MSTVPINEEPPYDSIIGLIIAILIMIIGMLL